MDLVDQVGREGGFREVAVLAKGIPVSSVDLASQIGKEEIAKVGPEGQPSVLDSGRRCDDDGVVGPGGDRTDQPEDEDRRQEDEDRRSGRDKTSQRETPWDVFRLAIGSRFVQTAGPEKHL